MAVQRVEQPSPYTVDVNTLGENFQTLKRALGFSGGRAPYAPLAMGLRPKQENPTEANARRMRPSTRPQLWHRGRGWGNKVEAEFKVTVTRLRLRVTPDLWPGCQNLLTVASLSSSLASLHLLVIKWRRGIVVSVVVRPMNEVRHPQRGTRLVLEWMTVLGQVYYHFDL